MVAVPGDTPSTPDTSEVSAAAADETFSDAVRTLHIGIVPTASMVTGAAIGVVWFWIPLTILIIGVSSIPSVVGFAVAGVLFVYLVRGVGRVERVRSEAVFALGIAVPPRKLSPYNGFQRWAHQLWLDVSSA
jgi:hypothetical protein